MAEQTTQGQESQGNGTDTLAETGNSRLDARKAIYARAGAGRIAETQLDLEDHPAAAAVIQALESGEIITDPENVELDDDGNIVVAPVEVAEEQTEVVEPPAPTATPEMVTLKVFGQDYVLPKEEVDRRGGVAAAQMQLGADHRFRQATHLASQAQSLYGELKVKLADVERREQALQSSATAGTPSGTQPATPTKSAPNDDALRAKVKSTVDVMFKGDAEATEKSLTEVLAMIPRGSDMSPEDVVALVLAKVEAKQLRDRADQQAEQIKHAQAQEARDVNNLMATKYKAINDDPDLRSMAQGMFRTARLDQRNKGRSLVSVADDVGARMMERIGGTPEGSATVQGEVRTRTSMKRRIPQPSAAGERAPAEPQDPGYPTKPSDIVNMYRRARNQPVN